MIIENTRKTEEHTEKITNLQETIDQIQKEIRGLRDDIDTVYLLETDSRKKLKRL